MRYFSLDHVALQGPDNCVYLHFPKHKLDHGNDELDMKYRLTDVTLESIITLKVVNLIRLLFVWPLKKSDFRNLWLKPLKRLLPRGEVRGMDLLRHHWRGVSLDLDHETTIFRPQITVSPLITLLYQNVINKWLRCQASICCTESDTICIHSQI